MIMNISWVFLDKCKATLDAIRAFDQMQYAIDHTDEDIKRVRERMSDIGSPKMSGMP